MSKHLNKEDWDTNLHIWKLESRDRRNSYNGSCLLDLHICYTLHYIIVVTGLFPVISGIFPFLKMQNTGLWFHCAICWCMCVCVCVCVCVFVCPAGGPTLQLPKKPTDFHAICYEYCATGTIAVCDFVYSIIIAWRLPKLTNSTV